MIKDYIRGYVKNYQVIQKEKLCYKPGNLYTSKIGRSENYIFVKVDFDQVSGYRKYYFLDLVRGIYKGFIFPEDIIEKELKK